jgi:NTP pyrophosphatase (non-canonical NTP hydrolase)
MALRAAELLREHGCMPFIPHLWWPWEHWSDGRHEQKYWLEMDFVWLKQCHALVRLNGQSPGADREVEFAEKHNIPVFQHIAEGAARGDELVPARLFITELQSGRFQGHIEKKEEKLKVDAPIRLSLADFQAAIAVWVHRQPFGKNQPSWQPLLGIVEEIGELAHAHLKEEQKIRTNENHDANAKDAVGDVFIYLMGYCISRGWSLEECIERAWDEVKKRDWNTNKHNGEPWMTTDEPHQNEHRGKEG